MKQFREHTGLVAPLDRANVDTDQIIPKQFLKRIERTGFGEFVFYDWRYLPDGQPDPSFVLNESRYQGASILVTDKNFGCGSSREHAPQAIMRWGKGIKAIVGESFAEIFFGNCVALGIPCAVVSEADIQKLMNTVEANPATEVTVDVQSKTASAGDVTVPFEMPDGVRQQFLEGKWDSTAELVAAKEAVAATASNLPYFNGWK